MSDNYITIECNGTAEIVEKKSRFISYVRPVSDEKDAQSFIEEIKKKHWDARHNVYAYRIGEKSSIERYSDDGEPGGTAGMPVLDVLRGQDVHDTAIVVTRYFGGILLGTGGLVRAYSKAAKEGLASAGLVKKMLYAVVEITADYNLSGKVQYEALNKGHIIEDTQYTDNVLYRILCEKGTEEKFITLIKDATAAKAQIEVVGEKYIGVPV